MGSFSWFGLLFGDQTHESVKLRKFLLKHTIGRLKRYVVEGACALDCACRRMKSAHRKNAWFFPKWSPLCTVFSPFRHVQKMALWRIFGFLGRKRKWIRESPFGIEHVLSVSVYRALKGALLVQRGQVLILHLWECHNK